MKHEIQILREDLTFQKKKLETPVKAWEPEMKLNIENKISQLEKAIKLLNKNKDGKE